MGLPDFDSLRKIGEAKLILISSLFFFFLEVTGGLLGIDVAEGQDDHPILIGALLLMVWVGMRLHNPPKRDVWSDEEREARRKE